MSDKHEHEHEWWYQPPIPNHRLFANREERGGYWYCNVGDMGGCGAISYERPADWPRGVSARSTA